MLFVQSYESESFFITPAALAVTEPRPATIADQRWIFQMNGVAIINVQGATKWGLASRPTTYLAEPRHCPDTRPR